MTRGYRTAWRLGILILGLVIVVPDGEGWADPFESVPGPAAKPPRPHRPSPPPQRTPEPEVPAPAAVPTPTPAVVAPREPSVQQGMYDGTYRGRFFAQAANPAGGGGFGGRRHCPSGGPVIMVVQGSGVFVKQIFPGPSMVAVYRGTVDARGSVSAAAGHPSGFSLTVSGSITGDRFVGNIDRHRCVFSIELTRH